MTDCVECFTVNAIESSLILLSCRSFQSVWTLLCGFCTENYLPQPNSSQVSGMCSWSQCRWFGARRGCFEFFLHQMTYQDAKTEQLCWLVLHCRHPGMSAKGCIPLQRSVAHQDWPGDEEIWACALETELLSGAGQCEKLGSGSGHFSHHHSFPSLETVWSISFFCLFHLGTNGSFPSVPAALKGFLVSPECIMQYCRASSFFFSTPCLYHVL